MHSSCFENPSDFLKLGLNRALLSFLTSASGTVLQEDNCFQSGLPAVQKKCVRALLRPQGHFFKNVMTKTENYTKSINKKNTLRKL